MPQGAARGRAQVLVSEGLRPHVQSVVFTGQRTMCMRFTPKYCIGPRSDVLHEWPLVGCLA